MQQDQGASVSATAGSERPRRGARRMALPRSLLLSLGLHLGLLLLAFGRPILQSRGVERVRREVTVAVAWSADPIAEEEEHEELQELLVEEFTIEPELVPTDIPGEDPGPELPEIEPLPLAEVLWSEYVSDFRPRKPEPAPPVETPPPVEPSPVPEPVPPTEEAEVAGVESTETAPTMIAGQCKDPDYPLRAQQRRIQGSVLLLISIDAEGKVRGVEVLESSGSSLLDEAARKGVLTWRFQPATRAGVAVPGEIEHRVSFRIVE